MQDGFQTTIFPDATEIGLAMTIILVEHRTELPAVDGMMAGMIAEERYATLLTMLTGGAGLNRYDCNLHVLASGELGPNGLFWYEWATGRFALPPMQAALIPHHDDDVVVVPVNPAIEAHKVAAERIRHHAGSVGRPVEHLVVKEVDDRFAIYDGDLAVSTWGRDSYGRPHRSDVAQREFGRRLNICMVGDEGLLRDTYPANLAALGDAADALGADLRFSFWDPRDSEFGGPESWTAKADGMVLPGGSDMEQVPGQIDVARITFLKNVPTLGLCLGMQTMATAYARYVAGINGANMEEADPLAERKTFTRLKDIHGEPLFRVGLKKIRLLPGTILAEAYDNKDEIAVHCNHRFVMETELAGPLERLGMTVSALQDNRDLADAIEVGGHPFYVGQQGHPELFARKDQPHPLFLSFIQSVLGSTSVD